MIYGYARVSTDMQDTLLQLNALNEYGCEKIYQEKMTGTKASRPEWDRCIEDLAPGDTLVLYSIDRMGRKLVNIAVALEKLKDKGVLVKTIKQDIDHTTPEGRLMTNLLASFAEFERDMISRRIKDGVQAKIRETGVWGKRPLYVDEMERAIRLYKRDVPIRKIADRTGIPISTLYRRLKKEAGN